MEERLRQAVERITLTEEADRRILDLERKVKERHQRRRTIRKGVMAACMGCLLVLGLSFFPKGSGQTPEWKITAYAREADEIQWISLEPGAKVLLEPIPGRDRYVMKMDLPEHYYYEKQSITLGQDTIYFWKKEIHWYPCKEDTGLPDVMTASMYIKILDENREEVDRVILEMTREYDNCYVQIKKTASD